jgi:hypothetical protein
LLFLVHGPFFPLRGFLSSRAQSDIFLYYVCLSHTPTEKTNSSGTLADPAVLSGNATATSQTAHDKFRRPAAGAALPWIFATATLVISPMFWLGQASGHDFQFHVASWLDAALQWRAGMWFPRWAVWANYGFGEPRFIFYPPASWMLGAGLGSVLPWRLVPGAVLWLSLALAGFSMFHLARRWMSPSAAIAAAVFYAANPYHLVIVYFRSDFAELMASALFPLLFSFALDEELSRWRRIASLAAVFAAIWLCNAPAAVIATYSLGAIIVFRALRGKSLRVLLEGAASVAAGFGVAAFYILPAAFERRWVNIEGALPPQLRPENNFLFARSNDVDFVRFNWKVSAVAVGVMAICLLAAIVARRAPRLPAAAWEPFAFLAALSAFMMLPLAEFAWRFAPELRFVQFPWRWLVPLNLSCWLLFAGATFRPHLNTGPVPPYTPTPNRLICWIWAATAFCLAVVAGTLVHTCWWDSEDIPFLQQAIASGHGYEGTDEYAPLGCDRYSLPERSPRVAFPDNGGEGQIHAARITRWAPDEKEVQVAAGHPETMAVKLIQYPAWKAEINGQPANIEGRPETAQMFLALPAGKDIVRLRFTRTPDRTIGAAISIGAAIVLLFAALAEKFHRGKPATLQAISASTTAMWR